MITEEKRKLYHQEITGYTVYLTLIIIPESDKSRMHPLHHETTGKDF